MGYTTVGGKRKIAPVMVGLAIVAAAGVIALPAAGAQSPPAAIGAAPLLAWEPCYPREGQFGCASLLVPIDHGDPVANKVPIALIRQEATDPARP
jgi:hypothetical protein